MPNARSIRRKLTKKVIQKLGLDTVIYRKTIGQTLDPYGEPVSAPVITQIPARIVIETDKRQEFWSDMGGLPDPKKEYICFYCDGTLDIRMGDKVIYPAGSGIEWIVEMIYPNMINDVCIITEARAYRDART